MKMQLSIEGDVVVDASALQADDGRTWEPLDGELPAAPPGTRRLAGHRRDPRWAAVADPFYRKCGAIDSSARSQVPASPWRRPAADDDAPLKWCLYPGANELSVRSVNGFGRQGCVAHASTAFP